MNVSGPSSFGPLLNHEHRVRSMPSISPIQHCLSAWTPRALAEVERPRPSVHDETSPPATTTPFVYRCLTGPDGAVKVDLVSGYVVRLLRFMREHGYASVTPQLPPEPMATSPFIDMTSGYFERSRATLPRQGDRAPWRLKQHYFKDAALFRGPIDEDNLLFRPAADRLQPTT